MKKNEIAEMETILPLALEWVMTRYLTPDIMVKHRKTK